MQHTTHYCRSWFTSAALDVSSLRRFFLENLLLFNILTTVVTCIVLATSDLPDAKHNAHIVGIVLLWTAFPIGVWGSLKENFGVMAVYVLYGLLAGVGKVVLTVVATVMVATSCQIEQSSFQGCGFAVVDELPCLANSTCSRDMINAYNDVANVMCEAWSTDDCSSAPSARTSMGLAPGAVLLICLDVFFALNSVLFGFVYYTRLEVAIPLKQDNGSDAVELLSLSAVSPIETPVVKSSYNFRDEGYNCPVVPTCDTMRTLTVPLVANPRPDLTRV
eukprot:TRINITY_DN73_c0_g1_i12.p1 TRINITY_DN73_c0_g1~~TRINITY_DN73_c0_g1_i12.p1  ORF type:complete len:276 (+),score=40.01 TRINITY_DN73_c0_g1_i12:78-905(+)